MLSYKESLKILKETSALLEGHFILSSGLHSNYYVQCAKLLSFPNLAKNIVRSLALKIKYAFKNDIDLILSPAMGGVVIGYEIGRLLNIETIFCERVNGKFEIRRGFHIKKRKKVTLTAVKKPGRYGSLSLNKDNVINFMEKPLGDNSYINGGFFVTNKKLIDHIKKDSDILEEQVFKKLSKMNQISAFKHDGFWQSMDTLHEKKLLNNLWNTNKAPWKKWK